MLQNCLSRNLEALIFSSPNKRTSIITDIQDIVEGFSHRVANYRSHPFCHRMLEVSVP
jgi:hypothetical protein